MKVRLIILVGSLLYLPVSQALNLNGFTRFGSLVELNARVSGVVQSIKVKPGQRVKKGDVLIA
ncbi:MAG: biotin/lipoyl-binding protein, partial [Gammaproteobacteria bacterium]|nr:biotin/lipoyl-binding protein [Gammaproteobacteria bacterium]